MTILNRMVLSLIGLLMTAMPVMAQSIPDPADFADLFGTVNGDPYSSVLLNQLFGPLFPSVASDADTVTVFSEIIGYFNVIILVVGGMMFFYNVTVGVLQSAHEGQVLGQRWSSLWAPLRVLFAVGLLVPVPTYGGYNLAQVGVAYVVRGSTNIASSVWQAAAQQILQGDVPVAASSARLNPDVIRALHENAACMNILNYQISQLSDSGDRVVKYVSPADTLTDSSILTGGYSGEDLEGLAVQSYLVQDESSGSPSYTNPGICGSYKTPDVPIYLRRIINENDGDNVSIAKAQALLTEFAEGHIRILSDVSDDLVAITSGGTQAPPIRDDIFVNVDTDPMMFTDEIATIMKDANDELNALNESLKDSAMETEGHGNMREALLTRITGVTPGGSCASGGGNVRSANCYGEGWIGAGAYYTTMARVNAEIGSLTNAQSTASGPGYQSIGGNSAVESALGGRGFLARKIMGSSLPVSDEEAARLFDRYEESYNYSVRPLAALGFTLTDEEVRTASQYEGDETRSFLDSVGRFFSAGIEKIQGPLINLFDPGRGGDPMMGLITLGNGLIAAGAAILVASMIGVRFAVAAVPFFSVLFAGGITLSIVLPLMPFFYWVLGVTGYFLLIVEAIIAVNLWALSHMRMDGDGISGAAGQKGWLMLLALLMTPVLMVFGFLVGMAIFRVTSDLISAGMFQVVSGLSGTSNPIRSLIVLIGGVIMTVAAYVFLIERSFSLISEFPNRVMNWMGEQINIGGGEERIRAAAAGTTIASNSAANNLEKGFTESQRGSDGQMSSAAQRGAKRAQRGVASFLGRGRIGPGK